MVDKQMLRVLWTAVDNSRPSEKWAILGLSQDIAPTLIHFPDGATQQWLTRCESARKNGTVPFSETVLIEFLSYNS